MILNLLSSCFKGNHWFLIYSFRVEDIFEFREHEVVKESQKYEHKFLFVGKNLDKDLLQKDLENCFDVWFINNLK